MWHYTPHDSEPIAYFGDAIKRKDGTQQLTITIHAEGDKLSAAHVYVAYTRKVDGKRTFTHYWFEIEKPGVVIGFVAPQSHNAKCELEDISALKQAMTSSDWKVMSSLMTTARGEPCMVDGKQISPPPIPKTVKGFWGEAHRIASQKGKGEVQ